MKLETDWEYDRIVQNLQKANKTSLQRFSQSLKKTLLYFSVCALCSICVLLVGENGGYEEVATNRFKCTQQGIQHETRQHIDKLSSFCLRNVDI